MIYTVYCHLKRRTPEVVGEYDTLADARKHLQDERDLMRLHDMKCYSDIATHNKITWAGGEMFIQQQENSI